MNTCQRCQHMLVVWEAVDKGVLSPEVKRQRERGDSTGQRVYANDGEEMLISNTDAYCPLNEYLITWDHSCASFVRGNKPGQ